MKKRFIFSDVLLLLLIAALLGWAVYEYGYRIPNSQKQIVRLYFRDANELAVGSTVRMMGTEVGYVSGIMLREGSDYVEVTIKTFSDALRIPSGSHFTVEFTGLVGSKSIEIIPPSVPRPTINGRSQYFVEEPIRLKDTLQYQINIAQALQRGAENFTDFFGKKKPVEELQHNIRASQGALVAANKKMIEIQQEVTDAHRDLGPGIRHASAIISNFASATGEARQITDPDYLGPTLAGAMHTVHMIFLEGQATIIGIQVEKKVDRFNERHLVNVADTMYRLRKQSEAVSVGRVVVGVNTEITKFHEFLLQAQDYLEGNRLMAMKRFQSGVQQFNQKLASFYRMLTGAEKQAEKRAQNNGLSGGGASKGDN